ncbi:MAG: hypothetical protein AMXMBFR76_03070 [Pseudomonadota bacterium]
MQPAALEDGAQRLAWPQQMRLTHDLVQLLRAQAVGQRRRGLRRGKEAGLRVALAGHARAWRLVSP